MVCFALKGHNKGRFGADEVESTHETIQEQSKRLAKLLKDAPIVVVHTGAGLSTAAGEGGVLFTLRRHGNDALSVFSNY